MIRLQAFAFFGLLCFSIGAFAAPASSDASSAGSNLTLADIINEPVIAVPLADPSFIPILTQNNQTVVDTNPAVQSQVDNIPSVISSISAAAATATAAATTTKPTTTAGSKVRRNAPTLPPSPIYSDTECAYANSISTPQTLWNAAALRACHEWFGVLGDPNPYPQSPIAYLPEDSWQTLMNVGGAFGFQFEYMVRDNPSPFAEFYQTSQNLCYSNMVALIAWMFNNCLAGDLSGFSNYQDPNSVIVYKAWRYLGPPTGFDSLDNDAAPI